MSRPSKPAQLHEISGGYIKHPERRNKNAPQPEKGIGPARDDLMDDERQCWDEIVSCICPGVLGNSDRIWVERAARLLARSRRDDKFTGSNETALQTYLSRLGMNPSDRTKITPRKPEEDDPADKYF